MAYSIKPYGKGGFSFVIALLLSVVYANAQHKPFEFIFTDSALNPIAAVGVKVQVLPNNLILLVKNSGIDSSVSFKVAIDRADSIKVTFTSPGYLQQQIKYAVNDTVLQRDTILLYLPNSTLPDATVLGPPIQVRGDTTFYRVDAFKSGEEQKLGELIDKLPDFRKNANGDLLFKGKIVEKITIDGEEIFADRIQLMLNSFPVHVLDQIQALENQSNEKLLKGLRDGNSVFLNLKLNKSKLQFAFGDFTAGAGLPDRYQFSPVLFALKNKLKIGYIANINNLGEGFGWREQEELKTEPQRGAEQWLMQEANIEIINNFDSRFYINNRLFDQRLQVNIPLSSKLALKQELSYTNDKQTQSTFALQTFVTDTGFLSRADTNELVVTPRVGVSTTSLLLRNTDHSQWEFRFVAGLNKSSSTLNNTFSFSSDSTASLSSDYRHNWRQLLLLAEHTNRVNSKKAIKWWASSANIYMPQNGTAISPSFAAIYALPNETFNTQQLNPQLNYSTAQTGMDFLLRKKKSVHTYTAQAQWERFAYESVSNFTTANGNAIIPFPPLIGNNNQHLVQAWLATARTYTVNGTTLNWRLKLGGQQLSQQSRGELNNFFLKPYTDASASSRTKWKNIITTEAQLTYNQQYAAPHQLYAGALPASFNMVRQYQGYATQQMQRIRATLSGTFSFPRNHRHYLMASSFLNLRDAVAYNRFDQFLQLSVDSMNSRNTRTMFLMYNYNYNNFRRNYYLSMSANWSFYQRQYLNNEELVLGNGQMKYISIVGQKQWNKKVFVYGEFSYGESNQEFPAGDGSFVRATNKEWFTKGRVSYNVNRFINVNSSATWLNNNVGTENVFRFVMVEAEAQYNPESKKYKLLLTCRNLANVRNYGSNNINALNESIRILPIIPRNFILSFAFNF